MVLCVCERDGGGVLKCVFVHVFAYFRLFVCSWIPPGCAVSRAYSCGRASFAFGIAAPAIVAPLLGLQVPPAPAHIAALPVVFGYGFCR